MRLDKIAKAEGVDARLLAKLEFFNPIASVKDRIGVSMIEAMERDGRIRPGETTLIEPTSGNTGIALAFAAAAKGYRLILVMPETMSVERRKMLRLLGAELVLTEGPKGMRGAIAKAEEIKAATPDAVIPQQFENPANPEIHRRTTAEEIWNDTGGEIDVLRLRHRHRRHDHRRRPGAEAAQAEPPHRRGRAGGQPDPFRRRARPAQDPGDRRRLHAAVLDTSIYDEVVTATNEEALTYARLAARLEGIPVGISSGARDRRGAQGRPRAGMGRQEHRHHHPLLRRALSFDGAVRGTGHVSRSLAAATLSCRKAVGVNYAAENELTSCR